MAQLAPSRDTAQHDPGFLSEALPVTAWGDLRSQMIPVKKATRDVISTQSEMSFSANPENPLSTFSLSSTNSKKLISSSLTDPTNLISSSLATGSTGCINVAGQFALQNDTLHVYNRSTLVTKDNNLLLTGEVIIFKSPLRYYGLIMKCDPEGNVIWSNMYDSTGTNNNNTLYYYKAIEMQDGSFIATGMSMHSSSSVKAEIVMTKIDQAGNTVWHRFYKSRLWTNNQTVASSYAIVRQMTQDPQSGDLIVAEDFYSLGRGLVRINPQNGDIVWARNYQTVNGVDDDHFGFHIKNDEIISFGQQYDTYYYTSVYRIKISDGNVIERRNFSNADWMARRLPPLAKDMVVLNNGNYALSGHNFAYRTDGSRMPNGSVMEFSPTLNFAGAYNFMTSVHPNGANTTLRLFPDGSGIFTQVQVNDGGQPSERYHVQFRSGQITRQRRKTLIDEGSLFDPPPVRLKDGSDLVIKMINNQVTGLSRTAFTKMFPTDLSSECLGVDDNSAGIEKFELQRIRDFQYSIGDNVIETISTRSLKKFTIPLFKMDECKTTVQCDSAKILVSDTVLCINNTLLVRTRKNPGCGITLPLEFNSPAVSTIIRPDDSTFLVTFNSPWSGYLSTSIGSCTNLADSVYVRAMPTAGPVSLGADAKICTGNPLTLRAGNHYAKYSWQDGSHDSTVTINHPGEYFVEVMDGCGSIFRDTVIVTNAGSMTVNLGPDRTTCNNESINLSAPDNFINYQWSASDGSINHSGRQMDVKPVTNTTYFLRVQGTAGCFGYDTVQVLVKYSAPLELGADTMLCDGEIIDLVVDPTFVSYLWQGGETANQIQVTGPGKYEVHATATNGCTSSDSVQVGFRRLPVVNLDKRSVICIDDIRLLNAGAHAKYLWQDGSTASTYQARLPGEYFVTVTDNYGCVATDTATITTLLPRPSNFLGQDTALCSYGYVDLKVTGDYSSYQWSNGARVRTISINRPGTYWTEVVDRNGCTGRDTVSIIGKECLEGLHVPNAFTPNRDGKNDVFKTLLFGDVEKFELTIYDRWGGRIYHSTDRFKGWDGMVGQSYANVGTYIWTCRYLLKGEQEVKRKGQVMLIR